MMSNQVATHQTVRVKRRQCKLPSTKWALADLSNVVSGLGGKVEYLPVLVSDTSVVDAEVNSLMVQKNT